MKKNARILSLLLSVAMVFGLMVVPAAAEGTPAKVTIAPVTADLAKDDVVTLDVTIENNPGFNVMTWAITFDEAKLALTDIVVGEKYAIGNKEIFVNYMDPIELVIAKVDDKTIGAVGAEYNFEADGLLFKLVFTALEDVNAEDITVGIENDEFMNAEEVLDVEFYYGEEKVNTGDDTTGDSSSGGSTTGGSTTGGSTTGGSTTGGSTTGGSTTGGSTTGGSTTGGSTTGGSTTGGSTTGGSTTGGSTTGGSTTGDSTTGGSTTGGSTTGGDDTGDDDTGDTTVETVLSTESEAAVTEAEVDETLKEAAGEDAAYYDVALNVTVCAKGFDADAEHDGCDVTRPATEEELKAFIEENNGIPVVLDIPEGTSPDTHEYKVYALVDGEVVELEVTVTEDGKLAVVAPGLCTIALAWSEIVVEEEVEEECQMILPRLLPVTVTVEEGAKVNTNAKFAIAYGARRTIKITVEEGYEVTDIVVNGKSVGAADTYTLKGVVKAQNIVIKTAKVVVEDAE